MKQRAQTKLPKLPMPRLWACYSDFFLKVQLGSRLQETCTERLEGFQCDPKLAVAWRSTRRLIVR